MGPLLGIGYHLYTDNLDTAVLLDEALLAKGTNLTGTVRWNRKYLPKGIKQKLSKRDSVACRKEKLVCVGWRDKNVSKLNRPQFMVKLVEGCWTVISELIEWNLEESQLKIHKTDCYFLKNI